MLNELSRLGNSRGRTYSRDPAKVEEEKEILKEINQKLAVPLEYYDRFANLLKIKKYGIARIFPDKGCDQGGTVTVEELERCVNVPQVKGGGSLYSIKLNTLPAYLSLSGILSYIEQSDIHFAEDKFVVGNETTQDIISNIGEVSLEELNLKSDVLKFLVDFKPAGTKSKFKLQKNVLESGTTENGYLYSTSTQVKLNNTYVLRSIAYYKKYPDFWNRDLLIAFKIIGQEQDGSIVILWKKLKDKEAPLLKGK
jgi:hypothetical protein